MKFIEFTRVCLLKYKWPSSKCIAKLFLLFIWINSFSIVAQQCDTASRQVTNLGAYGGLALDLAISNNGRLVAGFGAPASIFISDDTAQTWYRAFPIDSLDYKCGERGWGGGSVQILNNAKGWVAALCWEIAGTKSASAISFNNGDTGSWYTAVDAYLIESLGFKVNGIAAIGLSDYFLYVLTDGTYIVKLDSSNAISLNNIWDITSISGIDTNFFPSSIAIANNTNGYPFYVVIDSTQNRKGTATDGKLYKYDGNTFSQVALPNGIYADRIFTHPLNSNADTLFLSGKDSLDRYRFFRSFDAGSLWQEITPSSGVLAGIQNADYSPQWASLLPQSHGLILSCEGSGQASFDLGNSWINHNSLDTSSLSLPYSICFGASDTSFLLSSSTSTVYKGHNGINGNFEKTESEGLEALLIMDIEGNKNKSMFYLATQSGLAYTTKYKDTSVIGIDKWKSPYGYFPIEGTDILGGVTCVAIDPLDSLHVVAGYKNGFFVTHTGNNGFAKVNPIKFSGGNTREVKFISSQILIAVTHVPKGQTSSNGFGDIWRSTDGGDNWSKVSPSNFDGGNCIAVGFGKDTVIYVGTGLGSVEKGYLYKSIDLGISWTIVNDAPADQFYASQTNLAINEIEVDPRGTDTLYLVAGIDSTCAFVKSYDGGLSYQYIDAGVFSHEKVNFTSIEIDPHYPDSIIYFSNGKKLYVYNNLIDSVRKIYTGFPGDWIQDIALGSILVGTTTGFYGIETEENGTYVYTPAIHSSSQFELQIFPNPTSGQCYIQLEGIASYSEIKIDLLDLIGRPIKSVHINSYTEGERISIDFSSVENGIYYLKCKTHNDEVIRPIVISKN